MLIALLLAAQISCKTSDITMAEAKKLAVEMARMSANKQIEVDARNTKSLLGADWWQFRTFARNPAPTDVSNLMDWFSINKRNAEISDPVSESRVTIPSAVRLDQQRVREIHCLN
jgi:ABC-type amino acid transport system permease subunit